MSGSRVGSPVRESENANNGLDKARQEPGLDRPNATGSALGRGARHRTEDSYGTVLVGTVSILEYRNDERERYIYMYVYIYVCIDCPDQWERAAGGHGC